MELSIALTGFDKLHNNSESFQKRYPTAVSNAMRRAIRRDITKIKREIATSTGLGEALYGPKGKHGRETLDKLVTLIRARVTGDGHVLETGIKLKGVPKLIEEGGRTKPHLIKGHPWLAFDMATKRVFAKLVHHPGSMVRAHGIAGKMIQSSTGPAVKQEVGDATAKLLGAIFG